jgi:hypothetical protein
MLIYAQFASLFKFRVNASNMPPIPLGMILLPRALGRYAVLEATTLLMASYPVSSSSAELK